MNQEDIQKLAHMARIHVTKEEGEALAESFQSIIAYVDQIRDLEVSSTGDGEHPFYNKARVDDEEAVAPFSHQIIMDDMPLREGDHLKVKKIL